MYKIGKQRKTKDYSRKIERNKENLIQQKKGKEGKESKNKTTQIQNKVRCHNKHKCVSNHNNQML